MRHGYTHQRAVLVIEQAPENIRQDNEKRQNQAFQVQMRCKDDERCCQNDPGLDEGSGQEMNKRILNGAAKNNLLNETEASVGRYDQNCKGQRVSVEERELEQWLLRNSEFEEAPLKQRH
jgi:hypothetical protein